MPSLHWYRRFDRWLRDRAQRHVDSDTYKRREKAAYEATSAIGRALGWEPKQTERPGGSVTEPEEPKGHP
jgi:hypothetical protein